MVVSTGVEDITECSPMGQECSRWGWVGKGAFGWLVAERGRWKGLGAVGYPPGLWEKFWNWPEGYWRWGYQGRVGEELGAVR